MGLRAAYSKDMNYLVSFIILLATTIFLPLFGILGDKFNNKNMLIICALSIIILLYPLHISIINKNLLSLSIIGAIYLIPITCITALYPYLIANLYPTKLRFTGIGLSFNIADGIIGGFTPALSLFLIMYLKDQSAFSWYIFICAIISLISYFMIKKHTYSQ